MKFIMVVESENDDQNLQEIVTRKVRDLYRSGALCTTNGSGPIFDVNGNRVGNWEVS